MMIDTPIGAVLIPDETITYQPARRIPRITIDVQVITGAIISGYKGRPARTKATV